MPWKKTRRPAERSADLAAARSRALDLLTGRDFACQELYDRLTVRFTDQAAAAAVAEMLRLGFLNDEKYAARKASSLLAQHKSRRAIADALRRKGVDKAIIDGALAALFDQAPPEPEADPEVAAAAALVQRQYARRLAEGRQDLVLAALARRGFPYRVARAALALAQGEG